MWDSARQGQVRGAHVRGTKPGEERSLVAGGLLVCKRFGEHQVVAAVGVDSQGNEHVLGLAEGATENAVVVKALLEQLVERGVTPDRLTFH